jgi:hypothetical protein
MTGERARRAKPIGNDQKTDGLNAGNTQSRSGVSSAERGDTGAAGESSASVAKHTDRKPAPRKRRKPFVL